MIDLFAQNNQHFTKMKLCIVTCHFNWKRYEIPVRNLYRFLRQMERFDVPVYGAELYIQGTEPETADLENWETMGCRKSSILWQKEALLNLAEKNVPEEYDAIAFVDADLEFHSPTWERDTLRGLVHHPAVQMFERAKWTTRTGHISHTRYAVGRSRIDMENWTTHPGFAWAFDRQFFREIGGWYDCAPMGAGDLAMCYALEPAPNPKCNPERIYSDVGRLNHERYDRWREGVLTALGPRRPGYIPGTIYHEWHGDLEQRHYDKRGQWLTEFNADKHLSMTRRGYWEWTRRAPKQLVSDMSNYFTLRDDDGKNH